MLGGWREGEKVDGEGEKVDGQCVLCLDRERRMGRDGALTGCLTSHDRRQVSIFDRTSTAVLTAVLNHPANIALDRAR